MIYFVLSSVVGVVSVLQAGLNRQITKDWGLSSAILINAVYLLLIAGIFWYATLRFPQFFSVDFQTRVANFKWWYFFPPLCGFAVVLGIPAMIPHIGAVGVFICLVVAQMAASLLWDKFVEGLPLNAHQLVGVGIAIVGLVIANWKS